MLLEALSLWQLERGKESPARSALVLLLGSCGQRQLEPRCCFDAKQACKCLHVSGFQWVNFAADAGMDVEHLG